MSQRKAKESTLKKDSLFRMKHCNFAVGLKQDGKIDRRPWSGWRGEQRKINQKREEEEEEEGSKSKNELMNQEEKKKANANPQVSALLFLSPASLSLFLLSSSPQSGPVSPGHTHTHTHTYPKPKPGRPPPTYPTTPELQRSGICHPQPNTHSHTQILS